jgi:hypothetical protein
VSIRIFYLIVMLYYDTMSMHAIFYLIVKSFLLITHRYLLLGESIMTNGTVHLFDSVDCPGDESNGFSTNVTARFKV